MTNKLPHNIDTEQRVLAYCLLGECSEVLSILSPADFYATKHQLIFGAIRDLYQKNEPADFQVVAEALRSAGELEKAGGASYLVNLVDEVPSASSGEYFARSVKNYAVRRSVISRAAAITKSGYDPTCSVESLLDEAQGGFLEISLNAASVGEAAAPFADLSCQLMERLDSGQFAENRGVSTGLKQADDLLGGLFPGDLSIVAARPGNGKSALLLTIASNIAMQGDPVLIFSLEMPRLQLFERQIARMARVNVSKFRQPKTFARHEIERIAEALQSAYELPVFVDDTPYLAHGEMIRRARREHRKRGIRAIMIDYLQLIRISMPNRTRDLELGEVTRSLKGLAKELGVPVVLASQLNRQVELRKDPVPMLADLRDSGNIEQDADNVVFLYQDENTGEDYRWFYVAKQRQGVLAKNKLRWVGYTTSFENE